MIKKLICIWIVLALCFTAVPAFASEEKSPLMDEAGSSAPSGEDHPDTMKTAAIKGLVIRHGGKEVSVAWNNISRDAFEGDLVNGKGETFCDKYEGSELRKLFEDHGIEISEDSVITVTGEDGYTAEYTGAEILEKGKVYVALTQNGKMIKDARKRQGARIIVFGDPDSKRDVKDVTTISVR